MPASTHTHRFFPRADVDATQLCGWTKDGNIVHLTVATDTVAIGANAMVGNEKVRVVGGIRFDDPTNQEAYIELENGDNAPVSPAGTGRLRWNDATNRVEVSENTGAWVPILTAGGWTDTGAVVHLTTVTDTVAIGAAAMVGGEKLLVVGDTLTQGDIELTGDINNAGNWNLQRGGNNIIFVGGTVVQLHVPDFRFASGMVNPVIYQQGDATAGATGDTLLIHAQDTTGGGGDTAGDLHLRPGTGTTDGELELQDGGGTARVTIDSVGNVILNGTNQVRSTIGGATRFNVTNALITFQYMPDVAFSNNSVNPTFYQITDSTAGATGDTFTIHAQDTTGGGGDTAGDLHVRAGNGTTDGELELQDGAGNSTLRIDSTGNMYHDQNIFYMNGDLEWKPVSDRDGSVGTAANRFNLVRAVTITSGDYAFEDEFCAHCGERFKNGDEVVFLIRKQEKDECGKLVSYSVPVHVDCKRLFAKAA